MGSVLSEISAWIAAAVFAVPGRAGQSLRVVWAKMHFGSFGKGSRLGPGLGVFSPKNIFFGEDCQVGRGGFITADGGKIVLGDRVKINERIHLNASVMGEILIGSDCLIGPNVVFRTASHKFKDPSIPIAKQGHTFGSIFLGDDVWIASNVVVLPGVTIGSGAVVAAGSVVTKSVPKLAVAAGIPAKVVGKRGETDG